VRTEGGDLIDDGLALWFPGPASFTGEDVAELQLHGSVAVERVLVEAVSTLGARLAEPGEFTWRAFANGKLDLTQVEGLADLLEAETSLQHRQAMAGYRGALRERSEEWRRALIQALAQLEAAVDFPDEEDVPELIETRAAPIVRELRQSLRRAVEEGEGARKIASGLTIAFVGAPNAGKSSLFNALLQDNRAIVSERAGTTRDVISGTADLGGLKVTYQDLAGLRVDTADEIEVEGIRRARHAAENADLRLFCRPVGTPVEEAFESLRRNGDLDVSTMDDAAEYGGVSVHREDTIAHLRAVIAERLRAMASPGIAPTERQRLLLTKAAEELERFEESSALGPEIGAAILREAVRRLEELTGRIHTEDVLGDIFSSFCIGK
jgi:tRNA modification GTPase